MDWIALLKNKSKTRIFNKINKCRTAINKEPFDNIGSKSVKSLDEIKWGHKIATY